MDCRKFLYFKVEGFINILFFGFLEYYFLNMIFLYKEGFLFFIILYEFF